jgi:hypothetical protein
MPTISIRTAIPNASYSAASPIRCNMCRPPPMSLPAASSLRSTRLQFWSRRERHRVRHRHVHRPPVLDPWGNKCSWLARHRHDRIDMHMREGRGLAGVGRGQESSVGLLIRSRTKRSSSDWGMRYPAGPPRLRALISPLRIHLRTVSGFTPSRFATSSTVKYGASAISPPRLAGVC